MPNITVKDMDSQLKLSLSTIERLCEIYDGGHPYIAFTLSSEIHRLLIAGTNATKIRGDMVFSTVDRPYRADTVNAWHKLFYFHARVDPSQTPPQFIECVPQFMASAKVKPLKFREWWNRDMIYRAERPRNPSDPCTQYTRRTFIEQVRNKIGAHLDAEIPEELDRLQRIENFGMNMSLHYNKMVTSTRAGTLRVKIGPAPATIRQIAHEVVAALKEHLAAPVI